MADAARYDWRGRACSRRRDDGLSSAIMAARGVRGLARRLGLTFQAVSKWPRVPQAEVFRVAEAVGLAPETIRPDLAAWIAAERSRLRMERARSAFAVRSGMAGGRATTRDAEGVVRNFALLDLGLIAAAMAFAALEHGLPVRAVIGASIGGAAGGVGGGGGGPEQRARAYGMALAVAVARVPASAVADFVGCSRQAASNAATRYQRARDGDEADEADDSGHVIEVGKRRRARGPDEALNAAEGRFLAMLEGG